MRLYGNLLSSLRGIKGYGTNGTDISATSFDESSYENVHS